MKKIISKYKSKNINTKKYKKYKNMAEYARAY